jgi:hypothetical protein
MLIGIGFAITHIEEWGPTKEQIAAAPHWADERQRPPFLLVAATRGRPMKWEAARWLADRERRFLPDCAPLHIRSKQWLG